MEMGSSCMSKCATCVAALDPNLRCLAGHGDYEYQKAPQKLLLKALEKAIAEGNERDANEIRAAL